MTGTALIPLTGEVVDLSAPVEDLAEVLSRIAELEVELRNTRDRIRQEVCARADRENRRTLKPDGWVIEVDKPGQTEWQADLLEPLLTRLVDEGKITSDAARAALEPVPVLKPRAQPLSRLLDSPTLTDEDRDALRAAKRPTGRARRVTVKPGLPS